MEDQQITQSSTISPGDAFSTRESVRNATRAAATASFIAPNATTPTATPTRIPTLPPPEIVEYLFPLPDSDLSNYHLTHLDAIGAIELRSKLEGLLNSILENSPSVCISFDCFNPLREHIALIEQEILWRFPDIQFMNALEWSYARNLAQAGVQRATSQLAFLIETSLNTQAVADVADLPSSFHPGFEIEVEEVNNLFNEGERSFVAVVRLTDDANDARGGAIFAIRPSSSSDFIVHSVYGFWQPYFSSEPQVLIGDYTADSIPEIYIDQFQWHGGGIEMMESWVCGYQWVDDAWVSLLRNARSENAALYGLEALDGEGCLVVRGAVEIAWESQNAHQPIRMIVSKIDTYQCSWGEVEYVLDWQGDEYRQSASMVFPDRIEDFLELYCLGLGWSLMDQFDDLSGLIQLMENSLPDLERLMSDEYSPSYIDRYRFHLGRAYALSGDITNAVSVLSGVHLSPNDPYGEWKDTAERYLNLLPDIEEAELYFANFLHPPATPLNNIEAQDAASNGADLLFVQTDPESAIEYLESTVASSSLVAFEKYACSGPIDPDLSSSGLSPVFLLYRNYCASVKYILALAYESKNQDSLTAEMLYEIWDEYPESFYAFIARQRLVGQ